MEAFEVQIPMRDKPISVTVKHRDDARRQTFELYYCDELHGVLFCNEHNIWIYEPKHLAGLLLDAEHIQHLGKEISQRTV